jgi:Na+-translocating ferredoxin:NAD+ oxidoreductase RnfD subunit
MTNNWTEATRLGGLRRFAVAITILNLLGHLWFGFEQAWAVPLIALAAAYSTELLLEWLDARLSRREVRFGGSFRRLVDFLLSAHISGLAVGMLLYTNSRLWTVAFAACAAIASKTIFRIPSPRGSRHFFNPSNFGITVTLLLFPWVGIAPPYQFTENLHGVGGWILPAVIVCSGTFLNARFTKRLPLIAAWVSCFFAQALLRHVLLGTRLEAALLPMTGVAFILYTFYMITDPATAPSSARGQVFFGASVASTYGLLLACHIVFGLFFSLSIVSALRGLSLALREHLGRAAAMAPADEKALVARLSPKPDKGGNFGSLPALSHMGRASSLDADAFPPHVR